MTRDETSVAYNSPYLGFSKTLLSLHKQVSSLMVEFREKTGDRPPECLLQVADLLEAELLRRMVA